jgi:major vault protein
MPHDYVIKIPPLSYLHLQDLNQNVTRLVVGPQTYTCLDHQRVILGPEPMVVVPPRHYCLVENPVVRDSNNEAELDKFGQAKLRYAPSKLLLRTSLQ